MSLEPPPKSIASIQMLRGIAALMVVLVHVETQLARMGAGNPHWGWLAAGVDIFFVISGFIMWVSMNAAPGRTAGQFLLNRIVRIVPLYWLLTIFMAVALLWAPSLFQSTTYDHNHFVKSLLFIPDRHPVLAEFWPVIVPGWSLNYEMLFYLLFAAAIAMSKGSAPLRGLLVTAFLLLTLFIAAPLASHVEAFAFYSNPILLEFVFGICIGEVYVRGYLRPAKMWWLSVVLGFVLMPALSALGMHPLLSVGLPAAMIVAGAAFSHFFHCPPLERLGDSSYSLYLSHVVTLSAAGQAWRMLGMTALHPLLFTAAALAASVLVGWLTYQWLEKPVTKLAKMVVHRRSAFAK